MGGLRSDGDSDDDDFDEEPRKLSLCWGDANLIINLAENCRDITVLDLEGYEQASKLIRFFFNRLSSFNFILHS